MPRQERYGDYKPAPTDLALRQPSAEPQMKRMPTKSENFPQLRHTIKKSKAYVGNRCIQVWELLTCLSPHPRKNMVERNFLPARQFGQTSAGDAFSLLGNEAAGGPVLGLENSLDLSTACTYL